MNKLNVDLENCYGIKKLKMEFDFTKKRLFAIYAPNGTMKTSFANTFDALSKGQQPEDRIYKGKKSNWAVKIENGADLDKDKIFVIVPMNEQFKSNKMSTLLVNKQLKDKYDEIYERIGDKKNILVKALKISSGLKNNSEEALANDITHEPKAFFVSLASLLPRVEEENESVFSNIVYDEIFNKKVMEVLESPDFKRKLSQYIEIYDNVLSSSTFFRKGIFNHTNAETVAKNLKSQGFLRAGHSVYINTKNGRREVKKESELEEFIQEEMNSILKDESLAKAFKAIDSKISGHADLRGFRDYVETNKFILPELDNLPSLRQKLWVAYLAKNATEYKDLLSVYEGSKQEINAIINQAKAESTKWDDVVETFNRRFSVPFTVEVGNQDDVILKQEAPAIRFKFTPTPDDPVVAVEEEPLWKILSNGERRALYILNIIFEVRSRVESKQESLFIIDDIADSFDYKNKYAIIEYLNDMAKVNNFYQIILTHNFDFYRTVAGRLGIIRENRFHVEKSDAEITLVQEKYQKNPFETWKENLDKNDEMLIASIPFVRNLADYCGFPGHFQTLTSLLHSKAGTNLINVGDLEKIYKTVLNINGLSLKNTTRPIIKLIHDLATKICSDKKQEVELERKIVLAIAIRLKTEDFLISEINDTAFVNSITEYQTRALIKKYKEKFPKEDKKIKLADKVNLMTPENIHINSFMYEPILDMSNEHLKRLYLDVCNFQNKLNGDGVE